MVPAAESSTYSDKTWWMEFAVYSNELARWPPSASLCILKKEEKR
jgi:hypothetical protein